MILAQKSYVVLFVNLLLSSLKKLIFLMLMLILLCSAVCADDNTPKHHTREYNGEKLSLHFMNASLKDLLQLVHDYSGYCIKIDDGIDTKQTVFVHMQNVPWDHLLDEMGYEHGFIASYQDSTIYLIPSSDTSLKTGLVANKKNLLISDYSPNNSRTWKKIVITYGDGMKYVGEAIHNIPNGLGALINADGNVMYEGKWIDGKLNGFGRSYPSNNYPSSQELYYVGEFKNNEYNGYGVLNRPTGEGIGYRFEGMFKDGEPDGYGLYYDFESKQETHLEMKHMPFTADKINTCKDQ